jgi:hypothetical protein
VGAAAEAISFAVLQETVESSKLTPEVLAAVNIEESVSYRRLYDRAMRSEEAFRLAAYTAIGEGEFDLRDLGESSCRYIAPAVFRVFLLRGDLEAHRRISQRFRELASKHFYQARKDWEGMSDEVTRRPTGLLTLMVVPALSRAAEVAARGDAMRGVARTALAACRYRAATGRLPDKLDDLTGQYITVVPIDPFDGQPLRWKRTDRGAVVYSIGPDGKDGSGKPYDRNSRTGDIAFRVPG